MLSLIFCDLALDRPADEPVQGDPGGGRLANGLFVKFGWDPDVEASFVRLFRLFPCDFAELEIILDRSFRFRPNYVDRGLEIALKAELGYVVADPPKDAGRRHIGRDDPVEYLDVNYVNIICAD